MSITLVDNWQYIVLVGVAVTLAGLMQWNWFKQRTYALMLQAKRLAKDEILKSGEDQEQFVVDMLQSIPILLPVPRSVKLMAVKYLYNVAKDLVDDGALNNSI